VACPHFQIDGVAKTFDATRIDASPARHRRVRRPDHRPDHEYYTPRSSTREGARQLLQDRRCHQHHLRLSWVTVCIIPIFILAFLVYTSFEIGDMYGVSLRCGMLSNCHWPDHRCLRPVCDNAEVLLRCPACQGCPPEDDALDAAGNTTAAVGKASHRLCCLVSLSLFGAFVNRVNTAAINKNPTDPTSLPRDLTHIFSSCSSAHVPTGSLP